MHLQAVILKSIGGRDFEKVNKFIEEYLGQKGLAKISKTVTVQRDSKKQSIGINEIRNQSDFLFNKDINAKVLIIDEAEKLTTEAQNSLLKITEEPPENSLIVLLTSNENYLLQTIRSRSILIDLKDSREVEELKEFLENVRVKDATRIISHIKSIESSDNPKDSTVKFLNNLINSNNIDILGIGRILEIKKILIGLSTGVNLKNCLEYLTYILLN